MNDLLKSRARRSRPIIVLCVLLTAGVIAAILALRPERKEPIKIGAIISLSGAASHLSSVRDGMRLAVDELNSWGGINGRKIELIVADSKTDSREGKRAFSRLESTHRPLLYVSTNSTVSMALAPLAEENKVPLIGLVVSTPELTRQSPWAFRYYSSTPQEVLAILSILNRLKVKRLGILYLNDMFGVPVFNKLKDAFEKAGGTVRGVPFRGKNLDLKSAIAALKETEAVYTVGFVRHLGLALKQLKTENYHGFILGSSGVATLAIWHAPEANGVYTAAPIIYNPGFAFAKEVKEKYEARFEPTFTHQAASGYDVIKLIAGLLEDREISRENVKSLLEGGFIYSGVFGSIDVTPGEHDITFPLHPARIVDGEVEYLH